MRIAFDTNVLGYAEGLDDPVRHDRANAIVEGLHHYELALPIQVAAELHRLIMRRRRVSPAEANASVLYWMALLPHHLRTDLTTFALAQEISAAHGFQIFDAIILAASAEAGCRMLLSEDMQDGFIWRGVTVVNPFLPTLHPMLQDVLAG